IAGGAATRGAVVVGDGTAASNYTFSGVIGGTTIGSLTVKAHSTANISNNVTTSGAGFSNAGTTNVDTTNGAVAISNTGAVASTGALNFSGANSATFAGTTNAFVDGTLDEGFNVAGKVLNLTGTATDVGVGVNADTTVNAGNKIVVTAGDDL